MTREKAYKLREMIEKAVVSISDEDALEAVELFPYYKVGQAYEKDDRFQYLFKLYKVLQPHTSQIDWVPGETPSLYVEVAPPGVIPVWKQPTGGHDAYNKGDLVHFPGESDPIYESDVDNNVWAPDTYGWTMKQS